MHMLWVSFSRVDIAVEIQMGLCHSCNESRYLPPPANSVFQVSDAPYWGCLLLLRALSGAVDLPRVRRVCPLSAWSLRRVQQASLIPW